MKFRPGEAINYYKQLPPSGQETRAEYAQRIRDTLTEWEAVHDDEDVEAIVDLAARDKKLRVELPVAVVPVVEASTTTDSGRSVKSTKKVEKAKPLSSKEKLLAQRKQESEQLDTARVYYYPNQATFEQHIFEGEPDGNTHKGLHSLCIVNAAESSKRPTVVVSEQDAVLDTFVATAAFSGKEPKASSFFPTAWKKEQVMKAIEDAIRASWKSPSQSKNDGQAYGLTWAASIQVKGGAMLIGGIGGDGASPSTAVHTVFPAVNGKFLKL